MLGFRGSGGAARVLALLSILLVHGCEGDRASPPGADAAATTPDAKAKDGSAKLDGKGPPKPGKISLKVSTITGQQGRALLALQSNTSRICEFITSNSFSLPATAMTKNPGGGNPCGAKTSATIFQPGAYAVSVGIYVPGKQTPEKSVTLNVTVNGDTVANVNGGALSAP